MSEGNLALVTRFFDDRTQSDWETFVSFFTPDAEIDFTGLDRPYAELFRGREQIEAFFRAAALPWQEVSFVTSGAREEGDVVVVDVERTVRREPGGLGVTSELTALLTLRDGMISSWKMFGNRADAIKAAGLSGS